MYKTNNEIASDFNMWGEYFDIDGSVSFDEFSAMSVEEREQMIEDAFGTDDQQREKLGIRVNNQKAETAQF